MAVAYISMDHGIPVFGQKGCSVHIQEFIRTLIRKGIEVHLFSPNVEGKCPAELGSINIHPLPSLKGMDVVEKEQTALNANKILRETLASSGNFDLIYERYSLWSFSGMAYAQDEDIPGILEVNAPLIDEQEKHRTLINRQSAETVAQKVFSTASAIVPVSNEIASYLKQWPATKDKVHVIPNGIDPNKFVTKNLTSYSMDIDRPFTIGFVGTLKPWHGLSDLIDAFYFLQRTHQEARLEIVGDGPEKNSLIQKIFSKGLQDSVKLTGAVPPAKIPSILSSWDFAVAPYPKLPDFYFSPLKVYEYMAAGLPVVASKIGQIKNVIKHEENGLLIPPGDIISMAANFEKLYEDPTLRVRLGNAARATVQKSHTWEGVVDQVLQITENTSNCLPQKTGSI
jgi:glycosyltransferase involved in cell wall biosynthesis